MAYTISFPTNGPLPGIDDIARWLTEQGEPFEVDGDNQLTLRALPVRLEFDPATIMAFVDLHPKVPLTRLVNLLFELSVRLGSDVRLVGVGEVNRPGLWFRFADDQDRLRIAAALAQSEAHNNREAILQGLWQALGTLGQGHDWRWDVHKESVVQMMEVGAEDGIDVEQAAWHTENPQPGQVLPVPVQGDVHILAWRWLSEAYPSLARD